MPPSKIFTDDEPKKVHDDEPKNEEDLSARVRTLEAALAASQAAAPLTVIPEHGAGPGMEVRETWSQAEQEKATIADVNPVR